MPDVSVLRAGDLVEDSDCRALFVTREARRFSFAVVS